MRLGEVLGLRWNDVDLDQRRLAVRQAVILVAYKLMISDVKTDTGRRSIDLYERTIAVLKAWRSDSATNGSSSAQGRMRITT